MKKYTMADVKVIVCYQCPKRHTDFLFSLDEVPPKWLKCRICGKRMKQGLKP